MIKYIDSPEVEKLRKRISEKKAYLSKIENKYSYQKVQAEIMELENDYLPVLLQNSSVYYSEITNYIVKTIDTAIKFQCNSVLAYIPLNENYTGEPIVGIANVKQLQRYGTPGAVEISVTNMDGNGTAVRPLNLPLNELL